MIFVYICKRTNHYYKPFLFLLHHGQSSKTFFMYSQLSKYTQIKMEPVVHIPSIVDAVLNKIECLALEPFHLIVLDVENRFPFSVCNEFAAALSRIGEKVLIKIKCESHLTGSLLLSFILMSVVACRFQVNALLFLLTFDCCFESAQINRIHGGSIDKGNGIF